MKALTHYTSCIYVYGRYYFMSTEQILTFINSYILSKGILNRFLTFPLLSFSLTNEFLFSDYKKKTKENKINLWLVHKAVKLKIIHQFSFPFEWKHAKSTTITKSRVWVIRTTAKTIYRMQTNRSHWPMNRYAFDLCLGYKMTSFNAFWYPFEHFFLLNANFELIHNQTKGHFYRKIIQNNILTLW